MIRRVPVALVLAAAAVLLAGCRGVPAAGGPAAPVTVPATGGSASSGSAAGGSANGASAAGGSAAGRLADVESTLDRIERDVDGDAGR